MSVVGISTKGNVEQTELIRLIMDNQHPIIFATGDAGTGKNFVSIAAALQLVLDKRYGNICYSRNPVQCGESVGYLPGEVGEKLNPFMAPLMDNLNAIEKYGIITARNAAQKIQITPTFSLRGRSFEDTILIVDECQNFDKTMLQTVLTRMGKFTKIILLGSMNQIDDRIQKRKEICDFQRVMNALSEQEFVACINLTKSMRSPWCALVDKILGELK